MWNISSDEKISWVEKFKDVFINQKKGELGTIFNKETFGIHNGQLMEEYCSVELEEFNLKCNNFGLTMDAQIVCYDLPNNYFYFALGKKEDKALFESVLKWEDGIAIGNQYEYKIEPKLQFIKEHNHEMIKRRINIKPIHGEKIKLVIEPNSPECELFESNLEEIMGGSFYSYETSEVITTNTLWSKIKIYSDKGSSNPHVLLRGKDHPLFIENLYPKLNKENNKFTIEKHCWPVIIWVKLEDGEEIFYKYPKEKKWTFDKKIITVCLTDNLSFDWIIRDNEL